MAREARSIEQGAVYHLISRFVDREWFIQKPVEREHYLQLLGRAVLRSDWRLAAYAIMSNHIHLAAVAGRVPLGDWIRRAHSPFADSMNKTYDRIGVMFVRGPKAYLVKPRDVGNLIAYIHNNPVRAGVCARPSDSTWTSHRAYIGLTAAPSWLHVEIGLASVGSSDPSKVDNWISDPQRADTDGQFTEEAQEQQRELWRDAAMSPQQQVGVEELVTLTARMSGVSVAQLCSRSRTEAEVTARAAAVHCLATVGLSGPEIGRALGLSQQGVSVIRRRVTSTRVLELVANVLSERRAGGRVVASSASSD